MMKLGMRGRGKRGERSGLGDLNSLSVSAWLDPPPLCTSVSLSVKLGGGKT